MAFYAINVVSAKLFTELVTLPMRGCWGNSPVMALTITTIIANSIIVIIFFLMEVFLKCTSGHLKGKTASELG